MQGKITLITPPDIFENESKSVLFMHLGEEDQERVSKWFSESNVNEDINIYFYDHEIDLPWLFHAMGRCDHIVLNINRLTDVTKHLAGYILGKKKSYYRVDSDSTAAIYYFINQNRITNIELFLERVFNGENRS